MKKSMKRILSLVLSVCILASVACIASVSVSANDGSKTLPNVKDTIDAAIADGTVTEESLNTFYFYMPDSWKNEHNDYYDGTPDSYAAGVYWWGGTLHVDGKWPGYAVTETLEGQSNIYVARIPNDVDTIVWNNAVDGGQDQTAPIYPMAKQSANANVQWYLPNEDGYGFYPDGTLDLIGESFNGMIYVCNPAATSKNELSGKETYLGVWFFYYGDGTYSYYPTKEEAIAHDALYSNGEFPAYGFDIDNKEVNIKVGETDTIKPNKDTAKATIDNTKVATITQDAQGLVTVKGVAPGTATITFTYQDGDSIDTKECKVTVTEAPTTVTLKTSSKTLYVKQTYTIKPTVKNGKGSTTYSSSNTKVATVDKKGKVTAKKAGTAKITVTNNKVKKTFKVTVKNPKLNKSNVTLKLKGKKTFTLKITGKVGKATFKSNKTKIAKVDKKGKITAKKAGKANITVKTNGVTLKCKVTVKKK